MEFEKNIPEDQLNNVNGGDGVNEEIELPKCPNCGSSNVTHTVESGLLGYRCRDCGCEW